MELRKLAGAIPDPNHPYWRQFHKVSTINTAADTTEYSLPATETNRFDVFISLIDDKTVRPLTEYDLKEEEVIRHGVRHGLPSHGPGRFAFYPGNKLRILVSPGASGVAKEAKSLSLYYFRGIVHHESTGDTIDIRDEFTDPAVYYAVAKALSSKSIDPSSFFALFNAAVEIIANQPVRKPHAMAVS